MCVYTYKRIMRKVAANIMQVYLLLISGNLLLEVLGTSFPSLSWNNALEIKMIHKIKGRLIVHLQFFYSLKFEISSFTEGGVVKLY